MTAGLILLGAYLLVVQNMRGTLERLGDEFSVFAYLPPKLELAPAQIDALATDLRALGEVEEVQFISRDEALDRLRADLGDEADVLQGIGENPLPASFEIRLAAAARTPERVRELAERARQVQGIEDTRYGEEWVGVYARVLRAIELTGLVLGIGLFLVLSVIVGGTVRLAVYARADEIEIQRLVGAGGFYVRLPFYIQGALQGGGGALVATLLLYGVYRLEVPVWGAPLEMITGRLDPVFLGPMEILLLVVVGVGLGVAGATLWLLRLEAA